jgi:hypothetical protein
MVEFVVYDFNSIFFLCEMANVAILFANFYLTDVFLNGNFMFYGWDVIMFMRMSYDERILHLVT